MLPCIIIEGLLGCCCFKSWQHLRSDQDGNWLMTVHIHGNFIVQPYWEIRPPGTTTQHPTLSRYPDTELTSPCPNLLIPSARLGSDKHQFYKSLVWLDWEPNSRSPTRDASALTIRPPRPVFPFHRRLSCSVALRRAARAWPHDTRRSITLSHCLHTLSRDYLSLQPLTSNHCSQPAQSRPAAREGTSTQMPTN